MNKTKDYLPFNLKPSYLKDIYESKIIELGHKASYVNVEVDPAKGTKETLWDMAKEQHASIIVTGYNGIKGPKMDPTIAGTNIQFLALNASLPILVIKDPRLRSVKPDGCYRYAICYDGSDPCKHALQLVFKMMHPEDKLVSLTVKDSGIDSETVKAEIEEMRKKYGHTGQYECLIFEKPVSDAIYKVIKNYLKA
jgi:hypothetical protein